MKSPPIGKTSSTTLSLLKQSLRTLEAELEPIPVARWPAKAQNGGWSIAEIIHHLVLVEVQGLQELKEVVEGRNVSAMDLEKTAKPDLTKIQFPKPKLKTLAKYEPTTGIPAQYLLEGLRRARRETIAYVQKIGVARLREIGIKTTWAGTVNGSEFGECLAYHMLRHAEQVALASRKN